MAKKIYWESIKKWAVKVGAPIGVGGFALLFIYLSALGVIDVTSYSGDSVCAGTIEDPCEAYIDFSVNEDIFIYPVGYDPWGRDTPFYTDEGLESWKMYRSWGKGWREIKLNETCTGTWCGAPNNKGVKYSFVFREGREYQIKIVAMKEDPTKDIKWGFGPVDPVWFGIEGVYDLITNKILRDDLRTKNSVEIKDGITKEYISDEKRVLFSDDKEVLLNLQLESDYEVVVFGWNDMDLIAWFMLENFSGINFVDNVKFYDVNNDYEELIKDYTFKYKIENPIVNCSNNESGEGVCFFKEWESFSLLSELPSKNIQIGLFTDIVAGDKIEWIIEKDGFDIPEWALVVGTNAGFVTTRPSGDPQGTGSTDKQLDSVASKDTTPASVNKITEIGVWVNSFTAGNIEVGLYSSDGGDEPVNLLHSDSFAASATDNEWKYMTVDFDIDSSTTYWIAVYFASSTAVIDYVGPPGYESAVDITTGGLLSPWDDPSAPNTAFYGMYAIVEEREMIPPNVTINSPLNQSYTTTTILFNVTALDEIGMSNVNYTLNNGVTNFTMTNSSTSPTYWTATNSTMAEGSSTAIFYARDTSNNINNTENVTFFIDSINPNVNIVYPLNNTSWTDINLDVNYTRSDTNLASCWYSNDTYLVNITLASCGNITTVIWSESQHNVTVWANDSLGNENKSSVTFIIDLTNPNINITFPINNTNWSDVNLDVNYTRSDTNLASCWYSNDTYLKNISLTTNCNNITSVVWSEGQHNVTVWANDTAGNINNSKISFTIDSIKPDILIVFPPNNTNWTNKNLNVNYTASDNRGLFNCWYSNDTYSKNTTLATCGTNITDVIWSLAQHNVTIWANDSVGNENFSRITFSVYKFEEDIQFREVELGSNIYIIANRTLFGEVMCVDIGHPDYGINYSCSSDVNVSFNISNFRRTTISNGSSTIILNYTNISQYDAEYINISAHQYDEVDSFRLNISGFGNPRDVAFYKINTTDFDRAYMGYLIGKGVYLNVSCDSSGIGICVSENNLTFSNPGSQPIYFYIDDNIGDFTLTLNISGDLYGFEHEDTFDNDSYIDWDLTTGQLNLEGTVMASNSSYKEFSYDDFEDGTINSALWVKTADFSVAGGTWSYSGEIKEENGYIQLKTMYNDPNDEREDTSVTLQLAPHPTPLNMHVTDEIKFNLTNIYTATEGSGLPACSGNLKIYTGNTVIWTSMFIPSDPGNTESSSAKEMKFHLVKINSTSWWFNITGEEYSIGYNPFVYERWNNWTAGTWRIDDDGSLSDGTLNNTLYFDVNYGSTYAILFDNTVRDSAGGGDCFSATQTTKISYVNSSKWKRTNGTVISSSVFDSSGNIADATLSGWGYTHPTESVIPYLSADNGVNWEQVTWYAKHVFSNPGKHIKWRIDFVNVSVDYLNQTSYITNIKINTTQDNPSNITLDFGDDKITNFTIGGFLNSTNGSITVDLSNHSLTNSFTSVRSEYDHLYIIPLMVYTDSIGYITLNSYNLTYNPNPIRLNETSIQNFLGNSSGRLNFSIPVGTYFGNITFDDFRFDYAGGNDTINVTIHFPDYSYSNQTDITLWYSRWDYNFVPRFVDYLEFLPGSPTSKNVTPYGQSSNATHGAIFNLTNYGYGGRDANLSIYLNQTLPCVNLTMSLNQNKSSGFLINDSWFNIQKLSYLETTNFWMWADYDCSYANWTLFNPFISFRQCAENSTCSEVL